MREAATSVSSTVEAGQSLPATGSALILPATIIGSAMLLTGPALLLVARRRGN